MDRQEVIPLDARELGYLYDAITMSVSRSATRVACTRHAVDKYMRILRDENHLPETQYDMYAAELAGVFDTVPAVGRAEERRATTQMFSMRIIVGELSKMDESYETRFRAQLDRARAEVRVRNRGGGGAWPQAINREEEGWDEE